MTEILQIKKLSKRFGGMSALDDLSLSIREGTITSIIGPNGAGKTTLFNLLDGMIKQDSGSIVFKDKSIENLPAYQRALLGIGRLWQDIRLFKNLTVLENLLVAKKEQRGESLIRQFLNPKQVSKVENENQRSAREILNLLNLSEKANSLAQNLSYGQQKLIAIGRLLNNNADLLLLDEPTAGVSPLMIDEILKVISQLRERGKTILMIEHNIAKAVNVSDWIFVLEAGQLVLSGASSEVAATSQFKEIYMGL